MWAHGVALIRDGELEQVGRPRDLRPPSQPVPRRASLGVQNLFTMTRAGSEWAGSIGVLPRALQTAVPDGAQHVEVGFRSRDVRLEAMSTLSAPADLELGPATIEDIVYFGDRIEYELRHDGAKLLRRRRTNDDPTLAIGVQVIASTCADQALLYVDGRLVDPVRSGSPPRHTLQSLMTATDRSRRATPADTPTSSSRRLPGRSHSSSVVTANPS